MKNLGTKNPGVGFSVCTETTIRLQPDEHDLQLISPVLSVLGFEVKQSTEEESQVNLFSRSSFLEQDIVGQVIKDEHIDSVSEQPTRVFSDTIILPIRQYSLQDEFQSQMKSSILCRDMAQTILQMVTDHADCAVARSRRPEQTRDIVGKVAGALERFVSVNFGSSKCSFLGPESQTRMETSTRSGAPKDSFIDILSPEIVKLAEELIPSGCKSKALQYHCVATAASTKKRCRKSSKFDRRIFDGLLEELSKMPRPRPFTEVARISLALVKLVYCGSSHVPGVEDRLYKLLKHLEQNKMSLSLKDELKDLDYWIQQLEQAVQGQLSMDSKVERMQILAPSSLLVLDRAERLESASSNCGKGPHEDGSLFFFESHLNWVEIGFDSQPIFAASQTLQRYTKKWNLSESEIILDIERLVRKKLGDKDISREGYIYIFRHLEDFGWHKIGYTDNIEARLKIWQQQCTIPLDGRAEILESAERLAPHPRRLEALIHAELKTKRYRVIECRCEEKTRHKEWFQVDAHYAQKVILKWTRWMQGQPYNEKGEFTGAIADIPTLDVHAWGPIPSGTGGIRKSQTPSKRHERDRRSRLHASTAAHVKRQSPSVHSMQLRSRENHL